MFCLSPLDHLMSRFGSEPREWDRIIRRMKKKKN